MKTLLASAAFAATVLAPVPAMAQAVPAATVAVVDLERVTSECNACKTATAALRGQVTALQSRQTALATPLEAEQKSIQAAVDALNGKEPDTALQNRIKAFQAKQQQGAQELSAQQAQIQRNQQYIQKQVSDKLGPIYQSVMQKRGANLLMEVGSTLATTASIDVTSDVLAGLNAALPTIQAVAPAEAKQQQPQGR
jgi:Skp family chaperone for outer membrane proteins